MGRNLYPHVSFAICCVWFLQRARVLFCAYCVGHGAGTAFAMGCEEGTTSTCRGWEVEGWHRSLAPPLSPRLTDEGIVPLGGQEGASNNSSTHSYPHTCSGSSENGCDVGSSASLCTGTLQLLSGPCCGVCEVYGPLGPARSRRSSSCGQPHCLGGVCGGRIVSSGGKTSCCQSGR